MGTAGSPFSHAPPTAAGLHPCRDLLTAVHVPQFCTALPFPNLHLSSNKGHVKKKSYYFITLKSASVTELIFPTSLEDLHS